MLSFKPLKENASRHIASIEDSKGNFKETLWFTELEDEYDKPVDNFAEEMKQYTTSDSTPQDFRLKKGYKLSILPSNPVDNLQRESIAIFGAPGSGKTWQINNYVANYHLMYPRNKIDYYSANDQDASFDEETERHINRKKLWDVNGIIDVKQSGDSLIIFDDVLDVVVPIDPMDVYGEEYFQASLRDQLRMQKDCDAKAKSVNGYLNKSVVNILNLGRKYNINCIVVYHELRSGKPATFVVNLSSCCLLFPYLESRQTLMDYLKDRLSFSKQDIKQFEQEKFFNHNFMYLNKAGKRFYFTPNHFKFLT